MQKNNELVEWENRNGKELITLGNDRGALPSTDIALSKHKTQVPKTK